MLQEMLNKSDVIAAVSVDFGSIKLPEGVCSYVLDTKIVANDVELFLYCPFRDRKDDFRRSNLVFKAIEFNELIQCHGNSEASDLACFLLNDGKTVSVTIFHDII